MSFFTNMKEGFEAIGNMLYEKNYKPFLRPLIVVLVVFGIVYYFNSLIEGKVQSAVNKVEAKKAEAESAKEYQDSKEMYEKLIKQLPSYDKKDEWLATQLYSFFSKLGLDSNKTRANSDEDGDLTHASIVFDIELTYEQLGKLVEMIENNPEFMRISSLVVKRAEGSLGRLHTEMKVNTLFLKGHNGSAK